jgi:hypothetical protein
MTTQIRFVCNITGDSINNRYNNSDFHREGILYKNFNSRFRAISYMLSNELYKKTYSLNFFPINKNLKVLYLCNDDILLPYLNKKFSVDYMDYDNFKKNILNKDLILSEMNKYNFIICSDIYQYIPINDDLQYSFNILKKLLINDNNSFIIFSVPFVYNEETIEYFPNLNNYKIINNNNKFILENITKNNKKETFDNLIFNSNNLSHLEMRLFSYESLKNYFLKAEFNNINLLDINNSILKINGIYWSNNNSLILVVKTI